MHRILNQSFVWVYQTKDSICFERANGNIVKLHHMQDCCEHVYVESVVGELDDLEDTPILLAEESSNNDPDASESGTWTFYKFVTIRGYVDIRFYGSSNGYYSESVDITEYDKEGNEIE